MSVKGWSYHIPALVAVLARLLPGARTIDDAFITFRYARNILAGYGPVYNPGEHILGTTTPLYMTVLTILGFPLGGTQAPFPSISLAVNALSGALSCYLLIRIGKELDFPRAGYLSAMIWAVAPFSVTFAIGGMETSFFVALALGTLYLYLIQRPVASAVLGSLTLVTRPDAMLFLLPLMVSRFLQHFKGKPGEPEAPPITLTEGVAFSIPLMIWAAFSIPYYGSPLPGSLGAKSVAYSVPPEAALVRFLQHYATPFMEQMTLGTPWIGVGLILYPALYGAGSLMAMRKKPGSWAIWIYPWLYLSAYAIANPNIFRWYLTPPLPLYILGILAGVERLAWQTKRDWPVLLFGLAAFLLTLRGWTLEPDHGPERPAPQMAYVQLELRYQEAAEFLESHLTPPQTLAAGDIGVLGYHTGARVLDTVGLISPASRPFYPLAEEAYSSGNNYAIPSGLIESIQPDYLVLLEIYGRHTLLQDPDFRTDYHLVHTIDTDIYGSRGMLLYTRTADR